MRRDAGRTWMSLVVAAIEGGGDGLDLIKPRI